MNIYQNHRVILNIFIENTANEKLTIKSIFSKLEKAAVRLNIKRIQWPENDYIFQVCDYDDFKLACQNDLNTLQVILTTPTKKISNDEEKQDIMTQYHNDPLYGGHCGQKKLYAKLRSQFYWKNMSRDVAKFVQNCHKCQINKPKPRNKEKMTITPTPQKAFDIVIIDTIGPLPWSDINTR